MELLLASKDKKLRLTKDEELEMRKSGIVNRDRLIIGSLHWVVPMVYFFDRHLFDDNLTVAFIELCRAADIYDPSKKFRFITLAQKNIRKRLLDEGRKKTVRKKMKQVAYAVDNRTARAEIVTQAEKEELLSCLDERSQYIIKCKFRGDSNGQIGSRLGVTCERIRQISRDAIIAIRRRAGETGVAK